MKRKIITTSDGSKTIQIEDWNEQYHSKHGAVQEAYHVFIKHGLEHFIQLNKSRKEISILEVGFGTGLNSFITAIEAEKHKLHVDYVGVEAYPVSIEEIKQLNYPEIVSKNHYQLFKNLHQVSWAKAHIISQNFTLTKRQQFFNDIEDEGVFDIIYFDAFGARVQPELWTVEIFNKMSLALKENGVLVTYSAKGSVKRAMQDVGFSIEKLPGPPGKREMLRAIKI